MVSQLVVAEIFALPYREKNFESIAKIKTFFVQKISFRSVSTGLVSWRKEQ